MGDMMWLVLGWATGVLTLMQAQVIRAHRFRIRTANQGQR